MKAVTHQSLLTITLVIGLLFSGSIAEARRGKSGPANVYGKIKYVTSFADVKVKVVQAFGDLKVQVVTGGANSVGQWEIVESFEDFRVEIVDNFEDFTIEYVDAFPGVKK